jgi:NAD(P)-dependent dehydrogenase (short-subunit alcohol dehydrogenase family)
MESHTARWTSAAVPDQHGRVAVITGANTGLGFATAEVLAARGATVLLACPDPGRAADAARLVQSAEQGALTTLRAAADPQARGGEFYGPSGWWQFTGSPVTVSSSARSHDPGVQQRLWRESERLTGVTIAVPG